MLISVREAALPDAELISRMATETFYETYSWYNTRQNMEQYTAQHFNPAKTKEELQAPDTYFFLAFINDRPTGYAKLRNVEHPEQLKGKKNLEIERIYVYKKFQGQKAGLALINKCMETGRKLMLDTIWLGVWEKNTRALAFYESVGFQKFGTHNFQLGNDAQNDHLVKYDLK